MTILDLFVKRYVISSSRFVIPLALRRPTPLVKWMRFLSSPTIISPTSPPPPSTSAALHLAAVSRSRLRTVRDRISGIPPPYPVLAEGRGRQLQRAAYASSLGRDEEHDDECAQRSLRGGPRENARGRTGNGRRGGRVKSSAGEEGERRSQAKRTD